MALPNPTSRKAKHPHIARNKDICGGKPIIVGTRIKVSDIALEYEHMGMTPDGIVQAHPHLSLAQIHGALSYYYENIAEIDREIVEDRRMAEEMKKGFVSILERKPGETSDLHR